MVRGTTVRFVLTILSTVLLALQLLAPTASSAAAHSTTRASAPTVSDGFIAKRADEVASCGESEHPPGPTGPLRTRDRHGSATTSAFAPPVLVFMGYGSPATHPTEVGAEPHRTSRSSTAHSPAALQVFRC
ncbi:hypothetical protein [Streptomyces avermitilis]|uniref:hypothetical protein n=1 Tax=Streptomyces avermitilis TaxID=33903 RepID=UPI0037FD01F8